MEVGVGNTERRGHQGALTNGVDVLAPRHRHGAVSPSMVCTLEGDDVVTTRNLPGDFDRCFDSLRPRVPEEERVERRMRHNGEQTFDESEIWLVERDAALRMDELAALHCCCTADLGVRMTYEGQSLIGCAGKV